MICAWAQGVKPLPSLHTEGRWLVDKHGNQVVLHGVMDTPNMYFNGWRWGSPWGPNVANYDDNGVTKCLTYFETIFKGLELAKCDVFRLHLDPAWTNDPNKQETGSETGEANISRFSEARLKHFLPSLYLKLAELAMNHGMYVVVRPPGVCPANLKVGDYYQSYLMTVWDIFSQQSFVKEHAGQISIELANEPVSLKNAQGQDDPKALHDYFQPIVDKIRSNGFTGIIWAPGTGWQANYVSYATHPIEGENIGYAVHDYCGWYGCSDDTPDPQNKINQFHQQVPVVDFAPVIITEVDWSPYKPGTGHYNEHGDWVESNYGTWATGSTSKWGKAYKAMLDHYGNISMTLSGTGCLIDVDALFQTGAALPAFDGLAEACGKACMDWYAEYYNVNWPHADNEEETGDFYTLESVTAGAEHYDLLIGDKMLLTLKAVYRDGHTKDVTSLAEYTTDNNTVVSVTNSSLVALAAGEAQVTATYTDGKCNETQTTFTVKVTGVSLDDFTSVSSMAELGSKPFVIVGVETRKAFFGAGAQNLGYDDVSSVLNNKEIVGYKFKAEPVAGRTDCYLLRHITLNGSEYGVWGSPGYLNSQPVEQWCCFILGLNNQNGQDLKDGAVWEIQYVADKGFTLKNMGTGLYLKDATPAKYEMPEYFSFLVEKSSSGIQTVRTNVDSGYIYNLQGVRVGRLDEFSLLPHGIYIVGGKKVFI